METSPRNIVLVGPMGSGKTTVGRRLAHKLNQNFFDKPHEIIFRSLSNVLKKIGKKYYSPRGRSIDQVIQKIKLNNFKKVTLSGCIIEKLNKSLIIYQETGKKS